MFSCVLVRVCTSVCVYQRPYLRLFADLLQDMRLGDTAPDAANFSFQVLVTMSNVLHLVNPSRLPLFAFSWLELASHRLLLPRLLSAPHQAVRDATAYRWGEAPTLLWGPLVASHFLRHPACSVRVCSLIQPVTLLALCVVLHLLPPRVALGVVASHFQCARGHATPPLPPSPPSPRYPWHCLQGWPYVLRLVVDLLRFLYVLWL